MPLNEDAKAAASAMPEISVVVPCYNCAETIAQTVRSVTGQDFDDLELILVDDGSADETPALLQKLAAEDGRIRLHRQSNAGVSAARNQGIRLCRGRYLLFLDGDDLLAPGLFRLIHEVMTATPADTLCFLFTRREEELVPVGQAPGTVEQTAVLPLLERLTFSKRDVSFCNFVYDAQLLKSAGVLFTEGARYGEDWEFATKYLAHCSGAYLLKEYGYFYRTVEHSVTRTVGYSQTDAISAAQRATDYLNAMRHPFADVFAEYMYPRAAFSVAHRFGHSRNRELFNRLRREYDMEDVMRRMARNPHVDVKSKLAAAAWLVSPWLFYLICIV